MGIYTHTISEEFRDFLERQELDIREKYSGRYMYGKECFGIITDSPMKTLARLAIELAKERIPELVYELEELIEDATTDNMGLDMILYFPHYRWEEEEEDEDSLFEN